MTRPTINFNDVLKQNGAPMTPSEITALLDNDIAAANSIISNDSRYSPFWRLYSACVVTPALWLIKTLLATEVMPAMFLATATKTYLELKAWEVDITRKAAVKTQGHIRFIKADAAAEILIKAGTVISTGPELGKLLRLNVVQDTLIAAGAQSGLVPTVAAEAGTAYNLAAGYYVVLPQEIAGIASVVNDDDWITVVGADEETDDDLALRVRDKKAGTGNYHIDAVYRAALAAFAGIKSNQLFFEHDAPRGPGTANCYVMMDVGDAPTSLIDELNQHIASGYHGHGDDLLVLGMPRTPQQLSATYRLTATAPANAAAILEAMIRAAFRESAEYQQLPRIQPQSAFSFSILSTALHQQLPWLLAVRWQNADIKIGLNLPQIDTLTLSEDLL